METWEVEWIRNIAVDASEAEHIFPEMAACEAALESGYERSELAKETNNLFGMKLHGHPQYGYVAIPTKEFLAGEWKVVNAQWMKYDTLRECFEDRMATLNRLAWAKNKAGELMYPHYLAAIQATDAITYVTEVSKSWSTDPEKAQKVIAIYREAYPGEA